MYGIKKKKVYISGKITGLTYQEASDLFQDAENELKERGYKVINPFKIAPESHELKEDGMPSWSDHMRADIRALCLCDTIYMMSNWENSKGAKIELTIARWLELEIIFEIPNTCNFEGGMIC